MNIEMINVENAKISDIFESYEQLIGEVSNFIQTNLDDYCTPRRTVKKDSIHYEYQSFKLDAYPNDHISAEIQGIYENGIVIRIFARRDGNYYHDAIGTSGLLIIKENESPKFIINAIDGKEEQNRNISGTEESTLFIETNQNEVEAEFNKLGKRIDGNYVGKVKSNIFYSEKKHQIKMDITKEKIKLLMLKAIEKLEQMQKENTQSTRSK